METIGRVAIRHFFFLRFGRYSTRLGPCNSVAIRHKNKPKTPKPSDMQVPRPDLRIAIEKTAKQTAKGTRPNNNTHTIGLRIVLFKSMNGRPLRQMLRLSWHLLCLSRQTAPSNCHDCIPQWGAYSSTVSVGLGAKKAISSCSGIMPVSGPCIDS